jgi:hypothetical protein
VAVFLAIVGIGLLGAGTDMALAGHGCCGCNGGCYGCNGCHGCNGCNGGYGCHGCYGCHGYNHAPAPVAAPPAAAARRTAPSTTIAATPDRSHSRSPAGFRKISFRR